MSDEAGFLKAIADKPGERITRLAYADWLEENGRAQEAEFLKTQLQIEEMSARLIELGGQLDAKWLAAVGNVPTKSDEFTNRAGRQLRLDQLRQWYVYVGLIEGLPTAERNAHSIQSVVTNERGRGGHEPFLITPEERAIGYEGRYTFGTPSALPSTVCVAQFRSLRPTRDTNCDGSELTIIWFQHEWAFPIDPGVREQIRAIDWDQHAHDFDW
ncbi:Uncharacterized protein OS=Cystobacter violaceus Cb vi76 GN=Q664_31220 PE=4 SV=1 [Gemmata massiliana]|uniref:TIGR02996 domain-containing protein n=1 Tax=Gemmata massiliana TaxID=1210884 RepID=A0A6P2CUM9_9BACT|nr:TIGR02996 domain-containing protein [Gemmata massiliana]VTR92623.1 Uncharacterized protein OS=Cystobacter violaceus Cb vi76 GN=Q664_31220 PE=4 SV=1 [Gemmata massiliana]